MPVVTTLVAGLHGLLLLALLIPIVRMRRRTKVGIGHGGNLELHRRIRAHANFVETAPIALILLALIELADAPRMLVVALGAMLVVSRSIHAYGLTRREGYSFGRFWGTLGTWAVLAVASVEAIVLGVQHLQ